MIFVKSPEILSVFEDVIAPHKAGLPQDESIYGISVGVTEIVRKMQERGCDVSRHIVNQILDERGYKRRSFAKNLAMKSVEDRDEQFENIKEARAGGVPILSIDTKKKEVPHKTDIKLCPIYFLHITQSCHGGWTC